jgi:glycosyltransferase involved in cell wall biosynthesis
VTRVALLSPCFWPEVRRGGERIVRELANGLIARGHSPRLVTSHPGPPSHTVEDGLPIVRHWRPPDGRLRRRMFEDHLTHLPFSYMSLCRGDDELAHAFHPPDALAAARWSERTGRPAVLTFLGIPHRVGLTQRRLRVEILLRAAERCTLVALSRTAAQGFHDWLGLDAHVVYPGVDLDALRPGGERTEEPTIVCAADPSVENKRVPLLVEAFALVRRERPNARLLLMRPPDAALAAALERSHEGIELFEPRSEPAELAPLYARTWASVLPSWGESFGIVLAEALACGTPVVGAASGALPEVVDRDEVGRTFDGDSPEPLARALLDAFELASDPGTREACRRRAEDFSTDRATESYLELYRELLNR